MDVKNIAKLANLQISPNEEKKFNRQFSETLSAIKVIEELNTNNADPAYQVTGLKNVTRPDKIDRSRILSQLEVLAQANKTSQGYIVVPGVLKFSQ